MSKIQFFASQIVTSVSFLIILLIFPSLASAATVTNATNLCEPSYAKYVNVVTYDNTAKPGDAVKVKLLWGDPDPSSTYKLLVSRCNPDGSCSIAPGANSDDSWSTPISLPQPYIQGFESEVTLKATNTASMTTPAYLKLFKGDAEGKNYNEICKRLGTVTVIEPTVAEMKCYLDLSQVVTKDTEFSDITIKGFIHKLENTRYYLMIFPGQPNYTRTVGSFTATNPFADPTVGAGVIPYDAVFVVDLTKNSLDNGTFHLTQDTPDQRNTSKTLGQLEVRDYTVIIQGSHTSTPQAYTFCVSSPLTITSAPVTPNPVRVEILTSPLNAANVICNPNDPKYNAAKCSKGGGSNCGTFENPAIDTAIGCIHTNPADFVADILKWVTGIGGGIAFLMMLFGAFQMLTSGGNPETLNAGKDRLTSAVIGLLMIIFAVLLLQIIGVDILGIPGLGK